MVVCRRTPSRIGIICSDFLYRAWTSNPAAVGAAPTTAAHAIRPTASPRAAPGAVRSNHLMNVPLIGSYSARRPRQQLVGPEPLLQAVQEVVGAAPFGEKAVCSHLEDVELGRALGPAPGGEQLDRPGGGHRIVGRDREEQGRRGAGHVLDLPDSVDDRREV